MAETRRVIIFFAMKLPCLSIAALILTLFSAAGEEILIARGAASRWRYLDAALPPDKTWKEAGFSDEKWKEGPAPLGYGEENPGTTLSFGRDPDAKPLAAWFRLGFEVKDTARVKLLGLYLCSDDGAVVWLNGKEVARQNMPDGELKPDDTAVRALSNSEEGQYELFRLPAEAVKAGRNLIAVEVRQADAGSSDLFLDLELKSWAEGEAPKSDPLEDGLALLKKGRFEAAAGLLEQVPDDHPRRQEILRLLTQQIYPALGGGTRLLTALDRAWAAEPDSMELAYAWVRAHVEARTGLTEKVKPRALPAEVPEKWRWIVSGPKWPDNSKTMPRKDLLEDCDYLEEMIANCYSYADRRGEDWRGALDAVRLSLSGTDKTGRDTFLWRLTRFMGVFGDPHSSFGAGYGGPRGRVPVIFVPRGDKLLAVKEDRSAFLDPECPYVTAINEKPVAAWLTAASEGVPRASPQYQQRLTAEALSGLEAIAVQMGDKPGRGFKLQLASADGSRKAEANVPLGRGSRARDRTWPATGIRDGIGILRIAEMDSGEAFISSLNQAMMTYKETRGLIIDVRDNGGGTQDAIRTVLPWLMKPGDAPKVINVAAYRLPLVLPRPNPSGFLGLSGRGLHPFTSKVWNDAERASITAFLKTWKPQWTLPAGKFSDWHFMAISPATNPAAMPYTKPVIVLHDAGCFSATDNFLGALKDHPGVTLMGTTSGGGSGRMASYQLPHSGFPLTLCQMASFSAAGRTYDGNGVPPDVLLEAAPEDALRGHDSVLDAAMKRLTAAPSPPRVER